MICGRGLGQEFAKQYVDKKTILFCIFSHFVLWAIMALRNFQTFISLKEVSPLTIPHRPYTDIHLRMLLGQARPSSLRVFLLLVCPLSNKFPKPSFLIFNNIQETDSVKISNQHGRLRNIFTFDMNSIYCNAMKPKSEVGYLRNSCETVHQLPFYQSFRKLQFITTKKCHFE